MQENSNTHLNLFQIATRAGYGKALIKLGNNCDRVISLDGDMKNSTYSQEYKKAFPDRFIECYIAEQNMVFERFRAFTAFV